MSKTNFEPKPGDHVIVTIPCEPWALVGEEFVLSRCDAGGDWWGGSVIPRLYRPICLGPPTDFRIASEPKKAKVDRDAAWLLRLSGEGQTMDTDTMRRRLRAIARRLNGGKLP